MTRDEILDEIAAMSTGPAPDSPEALANRMRRVADLSGEYLDQGWDSQYLAEALNGAMSRFADAVSGLGG